MSRITYRGNLSAKAFPFVSRFFGRSIIVPGQDQNFSRQLTSQEDLDKDKGIPQAYYMHNVMPTADGFQAIGFNPEIDSSKSAFGRIFKLQDKAGNQVFFNHTSDGNNYVLHLGTKSWVQTTTIAGTAGKLVTVGTIAGQTYIYFQNIGCYMYDAASNSLIAITLTSLDPTKILGITGNFGYLVAWTLTSLAWSSTVDHTVATDPIDFTPDLSTGAGGGSVESLKGTISYIVPNSLGFIIYSQESPVAAIYSNNPRYPFTFKPIANAGGLVDPMLLSDDSQGNHYAYTTSGLQLVGITQAQTPFPELTDFLSGKLFEDFNDTFNTFSETVLTSPMKKAVSVISNRYLVISYGIASLTHAIIYDLIQKRFGKIKLNHVCAFEWEFAAPEVTETPRASIGFLQYDGSVKTIDFSVGSPNLNGTIVLGKYQYVRSRLMTLQEIQLENIKADSYTKVSVLVSMDGKNTDRTVIPYLAYSGAEYRKYNLCEVGLNHSVVVQGNFYLNSIELSFNINGKR